MKCSYLDISKKTPFKIFLRGAAIPGIIVTVIVILSSAYGVYTGVDMMSSVKAGLVWGLFLCFFCSIQIILEIMFLWSKNLKTGLFLALGYIFTISSCVLICITIL